MPGRYNFYQGMSENILISHQALGKLLAKYRKSARLSQAELAQRIGLSKKRGYENISRCDLLI